MDFSPKVNFSWRTILNYFTKVWSLSPLIIEYLFSKNGSTMKWVNDEHGILYTLQDTPHTWHTYRNGGKLCCKVSDDQSATKKAVIILWLTWRISSRVSKCPTFVSWAKVDHILKLHKMYKDKGENQLCLLN